MELLNVLLTGLLLGLIPATIAKRKGRSFLIWWAYGSLLFVVALVHSILCRPNFDSLERRQIGAGKRKCSRCAEWVQAEAEVCRYCGAEFSGYTIPASGGVTLAGKLLIFAVLAVGAVLGYRVFRAGSLWPHQTFSTPGSPVSHRHQQKRHPGSAVAVAGP